MNWLHYLLEANIYLGVFYLLYFILLGRETHYKLNRIYLLVTCILSYLIPIVQIGALRPHEEGGQFVTIISNTNFRPATTVQASHFTLQDGILYTYILGAAVMLIVFVWKIFQLIRLTKTQNDLLDDKYKLVRIEDSNTAFSFFNYVFIGTKVSGADTIIRHELVHITQKHSLDIVFMELIKVINWFNPFIYLLQRSLKTVHEYIADEQTAAFENDALTYSSFLVSNAYGISGSSITHSFFNYNLLKKRIIMLNQKRSGNLARLKYLMALPVCAGLLCASTLGFSKTYGLVDLAPQKVNDTTKKLKSPENKTPMIIKDQIDSVRVQAIDQQRISRIKLIPTTSPSKNPVIKTDTNPKSIRIVLDKPDEDMIKKLPGVKIDTNHNITAQGKAVTQVRIDGKAIKSGDQNEPMMQGSTIMVTGQQIPPPPPPVMKPLSAFEALSKYIAKYTRYPARAFENKLTGSIIVKFSVTDDHKLADISILKGIGSGCDEEVKRVVNAFSGTVDAEPGSYKLAVTYYMKGLEAPKTASADLFKKDPSFAGEVIIEGFPAK